MFVITMDQQGSRRTGDRVEALLADLAGLTEETGVVRPFARTVGDEVQAVLDDAVLVVDQALAMVRRGGWSVGVGIGPVDTPLPEDVRAGSGDAFVRARLAVERAKTRGRPVPLAVVGPDPTAGAAEAVLTLLGSVTARRTAAGWAVIDALRLPGTTQEDVAARLGISQQAVSQRLRAAQWPEEPPVRAAVTWLLARAEEAS